MKKQLLFNPRKMSIRITAIAALILLSTQLSFAQKWTKIAKDAELSSVSVQSVSITTVGNVPYVAYFEKTSGIGKVKMKNPSTGVWEQVGGDLDKDVNGFPTSLAFLNIYSDKAGKLYVAYGEVSGTLLYVSTFNGTDWVTVGGQVEGANVSVSDGSVNVANAATDRKCDLAFDSNNVPYITYAERVTTNVIDAEFNPIRTTVKGGYVKRFNGTSWEGVGNTAGLISSDANVLGNSIAIDANNVPYVVYINQGTSASNKLGPIVAYRLNSSKTWENLPIPAPVPSSDGSTTNYAANVSVARHISIAMDVDNNPNVAFFNTYASVAPNPVASGSNRAYQIRCTKSTGKWDYVGIAGPRDSYSNVLISDKSGNLYDVMMMLLVNKGTDYAFKVFQRDAAVSPWYELMNDPDPTVVSDHNTNGINYAGNLVSPAIAIGSDMTPYAAYVLNGNPIVEVYSKIITTTSATVITDVTATLGGEVLATAPVGTLTQRGIVYNTSTSTTPDPVTGDPVTTTNGLPTTSSVNKVVDGAITAGVFTAPVTGLKAATSYNVRSYFIYDSGLISDVDSSHILYTVYGENKVFRTAANLGTSSFEKNDIVKAYPNPTTDDVTVSLPNGAHIEKIAVYNSLGQLVSTGNKNTVSLQQLANGVYYLTIYTSEGNYSKKVVKK